MSAEKRISTAQIGLHCPLRPENYQTGRLSLSLSPSLCQCPPPLFCQNTTFIRTAGKELRKSIFPRLRPHGLRRRARNQSPIQIRLPPSYSAYSPFLRIFCLNCSLFGGPPSCWQPARVSRNLLENHALQNTLGMNSTSF